jgi:hypothetical protein
MSMSGVLDTLGIGATKRDELIASGDLVKVKIGRRAFVTTASVNAYVDRLVDEAQAANAS